MSFIVLLIQSNFGIVNFTFQVYLCPCKALRRTSNLIVEHINATYELNLFKATLWSYENQIDLIVNIAKIIKIIVVLITNPTFFAIFRLSVQYSAFSSEQLNSDLFLLLFRFGIDLNINHNIKTNIFYFLIIIFLS